MNWNKIYINAQNIETETDNAALIKMPINSEYSGYVFWHPRKLVKSAGHKGYRYEVVFNESFEFKLKKYGNGKYNKREVISETTIDAEEFKSIFHNEQLETVYPKKKKTHHIPNELDAPESVETIEDLVD